MKGIYFAVSLFGVILYMEMCGQLFRYNIYLMTGAIIACLCLIPGSGMAWISCVLYLVF